MTKTSIGPGCTVIDKTGRKGLFDFQLQFVDLFEELYQAVEADRWRARRMSLARARRVELEPQLIA